MVRYMGIHSKLPSLNCSNCGINPLRFEVFVAHFIIIVILENACFRVGRVLWRDLGYGQMILVVEEFAVWRKLRKEGMRRERLEGRE